MDYKLTQTNINFTMKRNHLIIILAAVILSACQQPPPKIEEAPPKVDLEATKTEVGALLDNYHKTMKSKDASEMAKILAEDGLYCGSDPSEIWDKEAFSDYIRKAFADTSVIINYIVDKRKIRVAKDGNSAMAVEQFIDAASPKIQVRVVSHVIKDGTAWKLDFNSWGLVPTNEDLPKINEVVGNEGKTENQ